VRCSYFCFASIDTSPAEFLPESTAHVFNPGAPAWGVDWCPIHEGDRNSKLSFMSCLIPLIGYLDRGFKQYLAVAPFPSNSHSPEIGTKVLRPSYSCIQIWSLAQEPTREDTGNLDPSTRQTEGRMSCEMVICHDSGPVHDLRWCPLPSHDSVRTHNCGLFHGETDQEKYLDSIRPRKLGLLGGIFEDGSLSIYVVPQPEDMQSHDRSSPVFGSHALSHW